EQREGVRVAIPQVGDYLFVDENSVRPAQLALQRIAHRSVTALTRTEHRRDHAALQVNAADGVALGIRDVDPAVSRVRDSLGPGELGFFGGTAIACIALFAGAREVIDSPGVRIDAIDSIALA